MSCCKPLMKLWISSKVTSSSMANRRHCLWFSLVLLICLEMLFFVVVVIYHAWLCGLMSLVILENSQSIFRYHPSLSPPSSCPHSSYTSVRSYSELHMFRMHVFALFMLAIWSSVQTKSDFPFSQGIDLRSQLKAFISPEPQKASRPLLSGRPGILIFCISSSMACVSFLALL